MNVVVYSQPGCTRCTATMRMMTKLGVPFDVVDIRQDHAAADRLRAMGYLETPVVEVGDVSWSGFRPDAIKELAGTAAGRGKLHGKYRVERIGGTPGKHDDCRYFVLDPQHDEHAAAAMRVYADAVRPTLPGLAADIDEWLDAE